MIDAEENAIRELLKNYEKALNDSDTEAVMPLYADDGVFMPQHYPTSVGIDSVRKAYAGVFETITLKVVFTIVELHQVASDWAFARTHSTGQSTVNASGLGGPEANQELFLFQKINDQWKIARYCFCTTNPPRA